MLSKRENEMEPNGAPPRRLTTCRTAVHPGTCPRAHRSQQREARLAAENRRLRHSCHEKLKVGPRAQASSEVRVQVQVDGNVAERSLTRDGDVGAGRYRRMVRQGGQGPAGLLGAAARLPKNPGTQKLTPPSSAAATVGAPVRARRRTKCLSFERKVPPPDKRCVCSHQFNGVRAARDNAFAGDARISIMCDTNVTVAAPHQGRGSDTCFELPNRIAKPYGTVASLGFEFASSRNISIT